MPADVPAAFFSYCRKDFEFALRLAKDLKAAGARSSGTSNYLSSIFGTSDGAQVWAVGENGTILHYTAQAGRWEPQTSDTNAVLFSVTFVRPQ